MSSKQERQTISTERRALSRRVTGLKPSGIRRFFDIATSMDDVVSLGVGEPDFATPWSIREAAVYSIEKGHTTYTSNRGLIELRTAIAEYLKKTQDLSFDPESEILVTVGVSQALDLSCRALIDEGDEVLVPEPCYVAYQPVVALAGGVPVAIPTAPAEGFCVTVQQLSNATTERTKAILLGNPSNPTGTLMNREQLEPIVRFASKNGIYIIADEIYDRLTYEEAICPVASIPGAREITITLKGFSKTHAMTGWRVGYALAPEKVLSGLAKIHAYSMLCAPTPAQKAAIEALEGAESAVSQMVAQYARRRKLIVDGLNRLGLDCHMPGGGFYAFPSIGSTGLSSSQFAEELLMRERVAVVPGEVFGDGGQGHIRCSYATSEEQIDKALDRMQKFLGAL